MKPHPDDERMFRPKSANALEGLPLDLGRLPAGSQPVSTSEDAADAITVNLAKRRLDVLRWFVARGEHGGTADELAEAFSLVHNATSPRVTELVAQLLLEKTATKRTTRQGSPAFVHVATAAGRSWLSRRNVEAA